MCTTVNIVNSNPDSNNSILLIQPTSLPALLDAVAGEIARLRQRPAEAETVARRLMQPTPLVTQGLVAGPHPVSNRQELIDLHFGGIEPAPLTAQQINLLAAHLVLREAVAGLLGLDVLTVL